jgi:hypothetical protein
VDGHNSKMTATKAGVLPWSPLQFSVGLQRGLHRLVQGCLEYSSIACGSQTPRTRRPEIGTEILPDLTNSPQVRHSRHPGCASCTVFVFVHCRSDSERACGLLSPQALLDTPGGVRTTGPLSALLFKL